MGYNMGEAAGLLAGSQTISAVIGVAEDTMANMGLDLSLIHISEPTRPY